MFRPASRFTIFLAALVFVLGACSGNPSKSPSYTVKRGDTLFAIAQRHRIDARDLARWNNIGRDNLIRPGQVLRLSPPGARGKTVVAKKRSEKKPAAAPVSPVS